MQSIPQEVFDKTQVKRVCGFDFKYSPDNPEYGVGVVTDGTIAQITNLEEATRTGKALQLAIFGVEPVQQTRLHW